MYLVLVGGGHVGLQLAKRLVARGHELLVLEKDSRQAQRLSNILGEEYVMHGDGCELHTQKSAGFNRADVVVAVTGEDEDNLVVCQLAKEVWNVERVLSRVNDPDHEEIFREIGIDHTVSATGIIFTLLEQQLQGDEIVPVGALHKGEVEVVESVLTHRSPLVGRRASEVNLPPGTSIVYLVRDGVGTAVTGETEFRAGDVVVTLVPTTRAEDLRTALTTPH
ncbi:MAG: TrkA family potassium uptake protein [Armatimonadetes bacterium]|nr:TrkA family potassium uptake protein [Armatimonadota bacterium]